MYALYRFSPTPVSTQLTRAQHAHCQPSAIPSRFPLSSLVAYSRKGKYVIYTILTHLSNPSLVVSLYFLALHSAPPHTNFYSLPTSASGQQQFVASSWRLFTVRCLFTVNQCLLSVIDYQLFTIYYYLLLLFTIYFCLAVTVTAFSHPTSPSFASTEGLRRSTSPACHVRHKRRCYTTSSLPSNP